MILTSSTQALSISSSFTKVKTQSDFDGVLSWIRDGGGFVHPGCKITSFPNMGFGLVCEDVKIGACEDIIVIPTALTLTSTSADEKQSLIELASSLATEMNLGKESKFYPLINTLPINIEEIPANYNDKQLFDLEGTSLCSDARAQKATWNNEVEELMQDTTNAFNRKEYLWARSMIQSRAYRFVTNKPKSYSSSSSNNQEDEDNSDSSGSKEKEEKEKEDHLTVFLASVSLSNHHDDVNKVAIIKRKKNGYRLVSGEKAIYPGQQIFISYGDLSIQQKANSFGWIDAPNKDEIKRCITPLALELNGVIHEVEMETFHCMKEGFSSFECNKEEVKRVVKELQQKGYCNDNSDGGYDEAYAVVKKELKNRIKNIKTGADFAHNNINNSNDSDSDSDSDEWKEMCKVIRSTEISAAEALLEAMI